MAATEARDEQVTPALDGPAGPPTTGFRILDTGATFAERRGAAERNAALLAKPRIASLGKSTYTRRIPKTDRVEAFDVELFVDIDHPMRRYAFHPNWGTQLVPLFDDAAKDGEGTVERWHLDKPLAKPGAGAFAHLSSNEPESVLSVREDIS